MAECKKCFHYQMCHSIDINAPCVAFKNKADVVEVVRCESCKYYNSNHYNCFVMRAKVRPTDFCSHGERKELND
jgi:hypothetical protein